VTATATTRRPLAWGSDHHARHGTLKILRGAAWKAGWLIVKHNDRLMPYPTNGFNSAVTVNNGGPLPVAGADANGGLRIIAKQPGIRFVLTDAVGITITVVNGGDITVTAPVASATAAVVRDALLANAQTAPLIDVAYTGTGAGLVLAFAIAAVPHVVMYGISKTERSNADDASNDNALVLGDPEEIFEFGCFGMLPGTNVAPPSRVYATDNQTVQQSYSPLLLPLDCISYEAGQAICRIA